MRTSAAGLAEIAGHEGIVLAPYLDSVGVWTIGIGHTKAAGGVDPAGLPKGRDQPLETVLRWFAEDIRRVEDEVSRAVKVPLRQSEFDALVSFHFNTGGIARANLTKKLNAGDKAGAAAGFDGWRRPPEIIPRRNKEKRLFAEGVYSNNGMALLIPADARGKPQYGRGQAVNVLTMLEGIAEPVQPQTDIPAPSRRPTPSPDQRPAEAAGEAVGGATLAGLAGALGIWWLAIALAVVAVIVVTRRWWWPKVRGLFKR